MSLKIFLVCAALFLVKVISVSSLPKNHNHHISNEIESTVVVVEPISKSTIRFQNGRWNTLDGTPTVLFAHRGEKVLLPEHSLPGYETASILGADYVEPDLCLTKDDHFVCYHDLFIADGTDVKDHPEFDHLKTLMPDGTYNWYIQNFTLVELQTLRLVQQKTGIRMQNYNLFFAIPTFQEYLEVIHRMTYKLNTVIGVVPELKSPAYHNANRTEKNFMEKRLLEILSATGYPINEIEEGNCKATVDGKTYNINCPPIIIQCFEKPTLEYLKEQTTIELLMLVEDAPLLTYKGMEEVAKVARYYSPWKEYLYVGVEKEFTYNNRTWNQTEIDNLGGFVSAQQFTAEAHKHGMKVIVWTIHDSREPSTRGCAIVPGCEKENKTLELNYFFNLGVDGIFIENVAESRQIREKFEYNHVLRTSGALAKGGNAFTVFTCLVAGWYCTNEKLKYNVN